jgi:Flp pilus assembly protein CpaB
MARRSGMSRRRLLVLGMAAVVVALVLVVGRSGGDAVAPTADGVTVLRSLGPIGRGMAVDVAVDAGLVGRLDPSPDEVPEGALTTLDGVQGRVAVFDIPAGTVLSDAMFVSPSRLEGGIVDRLSDDQHVAVAVTVDATRAVGGWMRPGDRVNILVVTGCADELALRNDAVRAGPEVEARCQRARHLFQAVRVLAVGPSSEPLPGAEPSASAEGAGRLTGPLTGTATIVLEVPPAAAAWIVTVGNDLWFSLVAPGYQPVPVPAPPSVWDQLPGEDPATLTPYGPGGRL